MAQSIITHYERFERIELIEPDYERLLADFSAKIFPQHHWVHYKPPISSVHGVAHPDAALIAKEGGEWLVVEVEIARHSTRDHVELQLTKLRDGWYRRRELQHLAERYADPAGVMGTLEGVQPRFLLILDEISGPIERVARELDFDVVHVVPFMSGKNLYAASIEGVAARRSKPRPVGIPVKLMDDPAAARFSLYSEEEVLPVLEAHAIVGARRVRLFPQADRRGFVVALARGELESILGPAPLYALTIEVDEPLRLSAIRTVGE